MVRRAEGDELRTDREPRAGRRVRDQPPVLLDRDDVESLFFQPFLSYTFANGATSATLQSEITRDLENYDTRAFALFQVNQIFKVGSQLMQGRVGVKHWYESEDFGPDSTELSLRLTFLFPK